MRTYTKIPQVWGSVLQLLQVALGSLTHKETHEYIITSDPSLCLQVFTERGKSLLSRPSIRIYTASAISCRNVKLALGPLRDKVQFL